jgi:hypothetical protein
MAMALLAAWAAWVVWICNSLSVGYRPMGLQTLEEAPLKRGFLFLGYPGTLMRQH